MQTLPANIAENSDYPNVEFIVLDYNSKDNIGHWIRRNLGHHIASGVLRYYRTDEPEFFNASHSKNMALRLGTGDIVGMVDADNYAGPGYARWINTVFSSFGSSTIITTLRKEAVPFRDQGGKFCVSRELFTSARGMDEDLVGFGMEDTDLINRMENAGGSRIYIENPKHLQFIGHSDVDRLSNFKFTNSLSKLYLQTTPSKANVTHLLYLFNDNSFLTVKYEFHDSLKTNLVKSFHGWILQESRPGQGVYRHLDGHISLNFGDGKVIAYEVRTGGMLHSPNDRTQEIWKEITDKDDLFIPYLMGYTECLNRIRYAENDENKNKINPNGWGRGRVSRNFDLNDSIEVA